MIRVGVVGFGLAGRIFHAAVIEAVEGLELAAIVQRTGTTAAEAYPNVATFRSVDEMLSDQTIQLVVVATPNISHFPIARQCLLAGRDVVVDKPFALTSGEAAELIRLAQAHNRLLTVYQNRRWDGDFRTVRDLVESGRFGRLVLYEAHFDRYRPKPNLHAWRESEEQGGGILLDLGAHLVDQALLLFGLPQTIWAEVRTEREGARSDDAFDLCLRYPAQGQSKSSSLTVWLRATCVARNPGPRFTLNGTQATFRKFGLDPQEDCLRAGDLFQSVPWGAEPEERWGSLTEDVNGSPVCQVIPTEHGDYRDYYRNVRDALLGVATLEVTPIQAWRTMRVLEMARQSSQEGCVIPCDWSHEP